MVPWASRRRKDLLDLLDRLTPKIHELNGKLEQIVERRPVTRQLSTHPGVGPLTALAFELVIGTPDRVNSGDRLSVFAFGHRLSVSGQNHLHGFCKGIRFSSRPKWLPSKLNWSVSCQEGALLSLGLVRRGHLIDAATALWSALRVKWRGPKTGVRVSLRSDGTARMRGEGE